MSKKWRDSFLLIYYNYYHLVEGSTEAEGKNIPEFNSVF